MLGKPVENHRAVRGSRQWLSMGYTSMQSQRLLYWEEGSKRMAVTTLRQRATGASSVPLSSKQVFCGNKFAILLQAEVSTGMSWHEKTASHLSRADTL